MDTAKLWFMLLCVCGSWILSLAVNCDWSTEYEFEERCCKACPSGEYPKEPCQENNSHSVCEKCSPDLDSTAKCFCKDNHLCSDEKCEKCDPRTICKPGHQLMRYGNFDFDYMCEPCPINTYNDAEDSVCKSITNITCDGVDKIFPGNQTHNARCVSPGSADPDPVHPSAALENASTFMVACSIVIVLTCLLFFIMYAAFQIFKYKTLKKLRKQSTHALPSDACSCKLSKEEMGEGSDSMTEDSDDHSKCDVYSIL